MMIDQVRINLLKVWEQDNPVWRDGFYWRLRIAIPAWDPFIHELRRAGMQETVNGPTWVYKQNHLPIAWSMSDIEKGILMKLRKAAVNWYLARAEKGAIL